MTRKEHPKDTKRHIPTFKTIEEEATFWDTHSSEEFSDGLTPIENIKFVKAQPKKGKALFSRIGMAYQADEKKSKSLGNLISTANSRLHYPRTRNKR